MEHVHRVKQVSLVLNGWRPGSRILEPSAIPGSVLTTAPAIKPVFRVARSITSCRAEHGIDTILNTRFISYRDHAATVQ